MANNPLILDGLHTPDGFEWLDPGSRVLRDEGVKPLIGLDGVGRSFHDFYRDEVFPMVVRLGVPLIVDDESGGFLRGDLSAREEKSLAALSEEIDWLRSINPAIRLGLYCRPDTQLTPDTHPSDRGGIGVRTFANLSRSRGSDGRWTGEGAIDRQDILFPSRYPVSPHDARQAGWERDTGMWIDLCRSHQKQCIPFISQAQLGEGEDYPLVSGWRMLMMIWHTAIHADGLVLWGRYSGMDASGGGLPTWWAAFDTLRDEGFADLSYEERGDRVNRLLNNGDSR